jgi:hypothetical protein
MHHRRQAMLALNAIDDSERLVARAPTGPVSHRTIIRPRREQRRDGPGKKVPFALLGFRREEFERDRRPACGPALLVNIADELHVRAGVCRLRASAQGLRMSSCAAWLRRRSYVTR